MSAYITQEFATPKALQVFVHDATKVALKVSEKPPLEDSEVVSLFVNTATGHIRIFCREKDLTSDILSHVPNSRFKRIHWQVHGTRH